MKNSQASAVSLYESWKNEALKHIKQSSTKTLELELLRNSKFTDFIALSPMAILIINHQTSSYEYCSTNIKNLFGYTSEEMLQGGVAFGTSLVAEQHKTIFGEAVIPAMFESMELYRKSKELKKIRMSYNFKLQRKDKKIIWLLQHMSVLETDDDGAALWSMVYMSDISSIKKDDTIDFSLSKIDNQGYFEPIFSTSFGPNHDKAYFTEREVEIIKLISAGCSTQQIADKLFISGYTVGTHRKNILKKLKAVPNTDLVSTLKMKGLLE